MQRCPTYTITAALHKGNDMLTSACYLNALNFILVLFCLFHFLALVLSVYVVLYLMLLNCRCLSWELK